MFFLHLTVIIYFIIYLNCKYFLEIGSAIQIVLKNQKKIENDIKNLVNQNSKLLELALKTNQEFRILIYKIFNIIFDFLLILK